MSTPGQGTRPFVPPRHTIDLSLPPRSRYRALAAEYKAEVSGLTGLFNKLLLDLTLPPSWLSTVNKVSKLILRKVHDNEQTQELRGISDETKVPMYLLVAFNIVLDILMGCTSGAVRCLEPGEQEIQAKMLHFRTLDWTMDPLRKVVVQLDYIRSLSAEPSKVLASSITYVGFTGVLTGVKPGLSMSLNFRAVHNGKTKAAHLRFYFHHLLVLFGRRPSIATMLRHYLLKESNMALVASDLEHRHTTAAYIILSNGDTAMVMEKDYSTAVLRSSSSFIAITNHDKGDKEDTTDHGQSLDIAKGAELRRIGAGIQDIIEESTDRLKCIESKWRAKVDSAVKYNHRRTRSQTRDGTGDPVANLSLTRLELLRWLCTYPTTNECTHFAALLDPCAGKVVWSRAYPQPLHHPDTNR